MDFGDNDYLDITDTSGRDSGYAVCCNSASASAEKFYLFNKGSSETTISFYVKTCTDCHGIIFSYTDKKPFSLDYVDGKLEISYGKDDTMPTDIEIKDNVWYQIVVTWAKNLKKVNLYVFEENGSNNPQIHSEKFLKNPFKPGGALSLGKFQISQEEKKWKKTDSFVGCFDALGFASKYVLRLMNHFLPMYTHTKSV